MKARMVNLHFCEEGEEGPVRLVHITTVSSSLSFFRGQVEYLRDNDFEVHVVSSPAGLSDRFPASAGVAVHGVQMERRVAPFRDLVALWRLWRLLVRLKPKIVHAHTPKAGLLGTLAARAAGVPVVFLSLFGLVQSTRHGVAKRGLDLLTRLACSLADRVWCDSHSVREIVVRDGLCPRRKVVTLNCGSSNGVDATGRFSPDLLSADSRPRLRESLGIPKDAFVVGYTGRIVGDKGMRELSEAWECVRVVEPNAHLLLVGEPESGDPLDAASGRRLAASPTVHRTGFVADVVPYYAAMDLFVLPSYREGLPNGNLEAAAMELPVVTTRVCGCVDSVEDGVTATVVPVRDSTALASAIIGYLGDPAKRFAHGKAGRARVLRDFRPDVIWTELRDSYRTVLKERSECRS